MLELPKDVTGGGKAELLLQVHAPVETVWRIFTDIERWPQISGVYEEARWLSAEQWRTGAYFEARMVWPHPVTVKHVVMSCREEQEIRWLVHAIGIVIERVIHFRAVDDGSTEISTHAIYFGSSIEPLPGELEDLLPQFVERFYLDVKRACEQE